MLQRSGSSLARREKDIVENLERKHDVAPIDMKDVIE
jgi:hypothetical protein